MKLYIVRHGETEENSRGIIQGNLNSKLNRQGLKQAKLLAKRLGNVNFDYIYSSDLERAKQTALEIFKYQNCPIKYVRPLRERGFGKFCGEKVRDMEKFLKGKGVDDVYYKKIAGIEPLVSMQARVIEFLDKIYKKHKNQTILISTHGGVKRNVLLFFNKLPIEKFHNYPRFENTSLSIIQFHENGDHEIILENDIKHLDINKKR